MFNFLSRWRSDRDQQFEQPAQVPLPALVPATRETVSQSLFWGFAIDPGESSLFYRSSEGKVVCLSLESGAVRWQSQELGFPLRVTDQVLWTIHSGGLQYRIAAFSTETGHLLHTSEWLPSRGFYLDFGYYAGHGEIVWLIRSHVDLTQQILSIFLSAQSHATGTYRPTEYFESLCQISLVTGEVSSQLKKTCNSLNQLAKPLMVEWEDQSYPPIPFNLIPQGSISERVIAIAQVRHYWLLLWAVQSINGHSSFVKLVVLSDKAAHRLQWERVVAPLEVVLPKC